MATSHVRTGSSRTDTCPRCFGTVRATNREVVCRDCGLVLEDTPMDHGPDWQAYAEDESNPERAKPGNRDRSDRGLGSDIGPGEMHPRRKTIHDHTKTGRKVDRARGYATTEIQRMAVALELPAHLADRGKHIFRTVHRESGGLEGFDLDTVAAACLLAACRDHHAGRVAADIAPVARCDIKLLQRRLRWVADVAGVGLAPPSLPARVRVVGSRLEGGQRAVYRAATRAADMDGATIAGASPSALAAALLYQAGPWTQREIADAADVTTAALRNRRDDLADAGEDTDPTAAA